MTVLDLSNQTVDAADIQLKVVKLKGALDARRELWGRLDVDEKRAWVKSGKDPIMTLAWQIYKYLKPWFEQEDIDA